MHSIRFQPITVRLDSRGRIHLPVEWCRKYVLAANTTFTLADLGGVFLLTPTHSDDNAKPSVAKEADR